MGQATMEELARQRETMERTHKKVKDVQHMNETSKWLLRGMSSFTGRIRNMFSKPPAHPDEKNKGGKKGSAAATGRRHSAAAATGGGGGASGSGGGRATSAGGATRSATRTRGGRAAGTTDDEFARRRAQEDAMLAELERGVGRLKGMAEATGDELRSQIKLADDIQEDVDKANAGMRANNRKARRIT